MASNVPNLPASVETIASTFNSLVRNSGGAGIAGSADDPRSALVFTSRLRQNALAEHIDRLAAITFKKATVVPNNRHDIVNAFLTKRRAVIKARDTSSSGLSDVSNQLVRAMPSIVMEVNPNSIEFDQPKRYVRQDTMIGSVFHHFTNSKGQNNDILTIRFQGNTGNLRRNGRTEEDRVRAYERLHIWHNLWQLTREPMLLSDGTANSFTISYVSPLFPVPVEFAGFFTHVLKFSENGKKPFSRDYSMEFIVQSTSPDLNTISASIHLAVTEAASKPGPESEILTESLA